MEKLIFQDIIDPKQRAQAIKESAYGVESGQIKKGYTQEQLMMFKDQLMTQSIEMQSLMEKLAALSAPLKAEIKTLKPVIKDLCRKLRDKYETIDGEICLYDDRENGMMNMYNTSGELMGTRKLLPGEKQTTIHSPITKTGS